MSRFSAALVVVVSTLWVGAAGVVWGTHTAGGADSYGYVSQAALWLDLDLIIEHPLPDDLDWPDLDATLTPLGYRPGPAPGSMVPVYSPGLPLVMAVFLAAAGPSAVFWVVPVLGAVLVAATAGLAFLIGGPTAAAAAALLLAMSPTLLFSVTWPMSDAPAAAWWALALLGVARSSLRSASLAGAAAALAILTRPNLVAVAVVPFLYLVGRAIRTRQRGDLERLAAFSALVVVGCLAVAAIHTSLYGSPLATGHGRLDDFIDVDPAWRPATAGEPTWLEELAILLARPLDNIRVYLLRLFEVEPALTLLAGLGVLILAARVNGVRAAGTGWLCVGVTAAVLASYLYFVRFNEWWLVRLLLPAYPALAVLAGLAVARMVDPLRRPVRVAIVMLLLGGGVALGIRGILDREVHYTWINESRYERVGELLAEELPPNAVLLAFQHSGSLRYYTDRPTVRFDVLHGHWLERATVDLQDRGYAPYVVIEDHELQLFRDRFGYTPMGALDWPPRVVFDGPVTVSLYAAADYWSDAAVSSATRRVSLQRVTDETGWAIRLDRISR